MVEVPPGREESMDQVNERARRQRTIIDPTVSLDERRAAAIAERQALLKSFGSEVFLTRPGSQEPNNTLIAWVTRYLVDDDGAVARGQALTQLLWLPELQRACVIEYLKGDAPYGQMNPGFAVTLKNGSTSPIKIENSYTWRPVPVQHDSIGWVDGPTGTGVPGYRTIQPGETVTLTTHFAIMNLRRHCLLAWDPVAWGESGALPERNDMIEVGYRAAGITGPDGETIELESLRRKSRAAADEDPAPIARRK
jgi:hypothetical protein